ncbi:MAG: hypothetical protein HYU28_01480 [Actinobacteria bacterium]|nr:hypothetical protein [Actinomycetota bacterium]
MGADSIPAEVLARLGPAPENVTGAGRSVVLAGNGLVVKTGAPEVIARERLILTRLADQLPVEVPRLRDSAERWVLVDQVPDDQAPWERSEVEAALTDLSALHRAFEGHPILDEAILRDPLGADLDASLGYARRVPGLDAILDGAAALAADPTPLLEALAGPPVTLLHGDPWPLNVLRPAPGRRVWIDWAGTARGPAALDLATWLDQAAWVLDAPRVSEQFERYAQAAGVDDVVAFRRGVDAATVLWFLTIDVPRLPVIRHAPAAVERLLEPRRHAMHRLGFAS